MNYYRQSPFANLTPVVKNLIIINVLFFIATWVLEHYGIDLTSLFSAFYFDSPLFKPWQIITYMFMHAGFWHIFMNMFVLFMFGPTLEYTLGSKRFLNYYFITGIGALAMQMLVQTIEVYHITGSFTIANHDLSLFQTSPSFEKLDDIYRGAILGASGAIFGVLVGFAVLFPNVELRIYGVIPIKAKYAVIGYVVWELFSGVSQFAGDSVAHFAHLGGALVGFILLKIWGYGSQDNFYS
ncbi:rhomboid family intramembrane serine protease [uncultured Mucilaginibacter sp.]|uniref:rhomboid family intramembrane serine protease n=1 Tax=uncultured Mucilaginibacter sp. TaxID=797541 RepID=UPI0025D6A948|nr:rhomboid family intramembrane serine protease [uncultured Mucilaginibacter sp.]